MTEDTKEKGRRYAQFLESLPQDDRDKLNLESLRIAENEHKNFRIMFRARHCYLCEKSLTSFYLQQPCLHWLLNPKGFKKEHLPLIAEKYGFFQMQSYLRWVANEESYLKNINDLEDEGTGKLFEVTIKYKKIEWSFSCSENDYLGHKTTQHSQHPHYHLQMRIDKRPFINYSDFHLGFSDYEIATIEAMKIAPNTVKGRFAFGESIGDFLTAYEAEDIVRSSLSTDAPDDAAIKIDTLIIADEGKTISGEEIYAIYEKSKKKGVTIASLAHEMPNSSAQTFISPGPGVVDQAPRSSRKKKR
ncbi:MAG: hypothetical protein KKA05_07925 [Alphaproteobacteria bacterium]|nr:hypothetical protein [Alphaproteobacteria bacterium]MBU0858525.1 hypothetical protein [Alphaproteobacteria bacterium]